MRLLTHFVAPEAFGVVSLLLGVVMLVKNFTFMPLGHAGARFLPDLAVVNGVGLLRRVMNRFLRWSWLAAGLGLLAGTAWCVWNGQSAWLAPLVVLLFVLDVKRSAEATFMGAARRQRALSLWNVGESWLRPGLAIAAAFWLGPSAGSVLLGYAAASTVLLLLVLAREPSDSGVDVAGKWTEARLSAEIRSYAAPLIPLAAIVWANTVGDRYIIGWLRTPEEVGVYVATYGLVNTPFLMAQGILTQTLRPVYLQKLAANHEADARKTYAVWIGCTTAVCLVGFVAVLALKDGIAWLLLAPEYRSGALLMPWIAGGAAIYAAGQVVALYLLAHKRSSWWVACEAAGAAVSIPVTILLVRRHGAFGAAVACPIYFGVTFVLQSILAMALSGARRATVVSQEEAGGGS